MARNSIATTPGRSPMYPRSGLFPMMLQSEYALTSYAPTIPVRTTGKLLQSASLRASPHY